jgi:AcrR family transcriptional regulator
MSSQDIKKYHHGNLRQALITAGIEMITEEGVSQLDLRKVARKANVSHMAPYRHFPDKKTLLVAVAEEGYRELAARIRDTYDSLPNDFIIRLEAFAKEYIEFAVKKPNLMRVMFSGLIIEFQQYPSLVEAVTNLFQPLIDMLSEGQECNEIVNAGCPSLGIVLWSMMHGLATLLIEHMLDGVVCEIHKDEMIHLCVHTLYNGLGRRRS